VTIVKGVIAPLAADDRTLGVETDFVKLVDRPAAPVFCIPPIVGPPLVEGRSSVLRVVSSMRPGEPFEAVSTQLSYADNP
jgi:hypothetical protein